MIVYRSPAVGQMVLGESSFFGLDLRERVLMIFIEELAL